MGLLYFTLDYLDYREEMNTMQELELKTMQELELKTMQELELKLSETLDSKNIYYCSQYGFIAVFDFDTVEPSIKKKYNNTERILFLRE